MSKGKQSKFLIIYFSVLGVGALALGYFAWSASSKADDAETQYKNAVRELDSLEGAKLSRTEENAKKKKEMVAEYVAKVQSLNADLMKYQVPINAAESSESFQKKLKEAADAVRAAAADKQVKLDPKFDLGMGKYLDVFPLAGTAPRLAAQLDGIVFLANAAMEAGVTHLDSLTRTEQPFEKGVAEEPKPDDKAKKTAKSTAAKGAAKARTETVVDESKVIERQPLTLSVTGKNNSILKLVEALGNTSPEKTSPHFFVIRTVRIENEKKEGPLKTITFVPQEITPDPNDKSSVYMQDAMYLLGNEAIKMSLDLDLVRFAAEPASAEKPAGTKSATKPADVTAKPAVSTPASE